MKIEITLDHTDIIGTNADYFCTFMYALQGLAKANKLQGAGKPFAEPMPKFSEQKTAPGLSPAEKAVADKIVDTIEKSSAKETAKPVTKEETVKTDDAKRKATIDEIKAIAASGNNKSAIIRTFMTEHYNKTKLNTLTDDELEEVLEMVKGL